jgi:hypothetical protein
MDFSVPSKLFRQFFHSPYKAMKGEEVCDRGDFLIIPSRALFRSSGRAFTGEILEPGSRLPGNGIQEFHGDEEGSTNIRS